MHRISIPIISSTLSITQAQKRRYYLRYIQPWNTGRIADAEAERYWMPVDLYVGMTCCGCMLMISEESDCMHLHTIKP